MEALSALPMNVYVVDDDRDTTECTRLLLEIWGHKVFVANCGADAIEQAPQIKPDLMLVDLGMPRVDGLQVARKVRQYSTLAHTSLVALTGYADQPHIDQALAAGFDECLVKPLPIDEMQALLERVRLRVGQARERTAQAREAAAQTRQTNDRTRSSLGVTHAADADGVVDVRVRKSGISELFCFADRTKAEELRAWLHERGCRLGPIFEPAAGEVAFFNYSRQLARRLLRENRRFRLAG